jgi:hypothetical protein
MGSNLQSSERDSSPQCRESWLHTVEGINRFREIIPDRSHPGKGSRESEDVAVRVLRVDVIREGESWLSLTVRK